jgi:anti-sigma regulatory factor (Ser/Thr protein kinase)
MRTQGWDEMVDPAAAETFRHMALLYSGPAEYLLGLRPFIRAGRVKGEAILVAVPRRNAQLLRQELGGESAGVTFTDMTQVGRNPARIIPEFLRFARRNPGRRTRFIAEPAWPGRSAAEVGETAQHEALANLAFGQASATMLCPYNAAELKPAGVAQLEHTHPLMVSDGHEHPSSRYSSANSTPGGGRALRTPPLRAEVLGYETDLRAVRRFVASSSRRAGLSTERTTDLVIAASELGANTIRHTPDGGTVTIWRTPEELICQIQDSGVITDPLAGHRMPHDDRAGGQGLWLVNQLCDLVQRRTSNAGTITRLHMRLTPSHDVIRPVLQ